jgi:hypothetical protein
MNALPNLERRMWKAVFKRFGMSKTLKLKLEDCGPVVAQ